MQFASLRRFGVCVALTVGAGCGAAGVPGDAKTTVVSFSGLDCSDCGDELARELVKLEGVYKTAFDKRKAELTVVAAPQVDAFALAQSKKNPKEEWELVVGAGKGSYLAWEKAPDGADVKELAKDGEDVPDLTPHLVNGKVTIVDFSAKWCEPCRDLDAHVVEAMKARPDLAYRKLDIGDWDTPLATRYMKGIAALPYVIVYDKTGQKVDAIAGIDLKRLDAAIVKAGGAAPAAGAAPSEAPK